MQDWHSAAAASARLGLRGHFGGGEGFGKQCCEFLLNSSGLPSCRAKRLCKMRSTARCGSELAPNSVSGVDDIAAKARRAARCVLHDALERLLETNRGLRYSNEALAAARRLAAEREEAERAAFAAAVADWRKGSGPVLVEREDIGLRSRAPREIGRAKSLWMGPWRSVIWQLCGVLVCAVCRTLAGQHHALKPPEGSHLDGLGDSQSRQVGTKRRQVVAYGLGVVAPIGQKYLRAS
ncbi:unnamed protein product [Prorocentrum cordatum]|uniref:Uncharacterized protein n=1 Tax=Prorocentrum cordatum TaxID=2364126 RepID=A0ABN9SUT1_9DINO|nr:unnamed protein product [Polarella glacialis]